MKVSTVRKTSVRAIVIVIAASAVGLGCELIVDFDRTKIPVEGNDAAVVVPEGGTDAPIDTSVAETGTDSSVADSADAADAFDAADAEDGD